MATKRIVFPKIGVIGQSEAVQLQRVCIFEYSAYISGKIRGIIGLIMIQYRIPHLGTYSLFTVYSSIVSGSLFVVTQ